LGACLQRKEEGKDDELYCFGFRRPKNGRTASGIKDVGSGPRPVTRVGESTARKEGHG